jgi:hypothetical protein
MPSAAAWRVAMLVVTASASIHLDMLVVRALKISQLTDGGMSPTYESMH